MGCHPWLETMRDILAEATFGASLVGIGVLTGWFAVTLRSPAMGALGAVFAVLGVVAAGLQVAAAEGTEAAAPPDGPTPGVSLSSAPECVREEVPPSSKLVWMYLATEGPSTLDDVVDGTQLTPRTTRNAISRLEKHHVISERPADQRFGQLYYDLRGPQEAPSSHSADE